MSMNDDLILQLTDDEDLELSMDSESDLGLDLAEPVPITSYDLLLNKPTVNGRTIVGDKTVAYYLQDGLIIDGGDALGVVT